MMLELGPNAAKIALIAIVAIVVCYFTKLLSRL